VLCFYDYFVTQTAINLNWNVNYVQCRVALSLADGYFRPDRNHKLTFTLFRHNSQIFTFSLFSLASWLTLYGTQVLFFCVTIINDAESVFNVAEITTLDGKCWTTHPAAANYATFGLFHLVSLIFTHVNVVRQQRTKRTMARNVPPRIIFDILVFSYTKNMWMKCSIHRLISGIQHSLYLRLLQSESFCFLPLETVVGIIGNVFM
jgi:hypothetical protein